MISSFCNIWFGYFFESDTTGEKDFEEFYTDDEKIDLERFKNIGIVLNNLSFNEKKLEIFLNKINAMQKKSSWNKSKIVNLFNDMIPNFSYIDKKNH